MNNQKNLKYELGLGTLLSILMKGKYVILIITFLATVSAIVYTTKVIAVYKGSVLVEIGEVFSNNEVFNNQFSSIINLDNVYTLKEVIGRTGEVNSTIINGVTNMIQLSFEGPDKDEVKLKLDNAVNSILSRHQEKAEFYQNDHTKIRMTRTIGKIIINKQPIEPKKYLIIAVGLISGLMFGIFIVFLREIYTNKRKYFLSECA